VRTRHDDISGSCIGALFHSRVSTASKATALKKCEAHTRKNPGVYVSEVAEGVVRVSSANHSVLWRLSCLNSSKPDVTVTRGTRYLSVPSGCSLSGLDVTYKMLPAALRSYRNVELVAWSYELPHSWSAKFNTLANVTQLLRDADVWRKANELEAEFRQHLMAQALATSATYDFGGVIVAVAAAAILLGLCISQIFLWRSLRSLPSKDNKDEDEDKGKESTVVSKQFWLFSSKGVQTDGAPKSAAPKQPPAFNSKEPPLYETGSNCSCCNDDDDDYNATDEKEVRLEREKAARRGRTNRRRRRKCSAATKGSLDPNAKPFEPQTAVRFRDASCSIRSLNSTEIKQFDR
jgi:hypothetical protein